jgi:hypothetical protein
MVRHCDHCGKKVYLCETDEQINFYTAVKFCIAVADPKEVLNVERITPFSRATLPNASDPIGQRDNSPSTSTGRSRSNVWRRALPNEQFEELQHDDIPVFLRKHQDVADYAIPAFLLKSKK